MRRVPQAYTERGQELPRAGKWGLKTHDSQGMSGITLSAQTMDTVQEAWVAHYASVHLHNHDEARAVAVDKLGNVYVTGHSGYFVYSGESYGGDYYTVKYNSAGVVQWAARHVSNIDESPAAIAVDSAGNVYVTGTSWEGWETCLDIVTVKYSANGTQEWVARYHNRIDDAASAIAVDDMGNVYVAGYSTGAPSENQDDCDYVTIKYDTSGIQRWVARYNGSGRSWDGAMDLALDKSGNIYVTGVSLGSGGTYDCVTIKYNHAGTSLWEARYNSPANSHEGGYDIAVDGSNSVFISGRGIGPTASDDFLTVKYDSNGVEQWVARYDGPTSLADGATDLAVDQNGNAYVIGWSTGADSTYDYVTIKYDPSGNMEWSARYPGSVKGDDDPYAISVDQAGFVYVTGLSGKGAATIKYSAKGEQQWMSEKVHSTALNLAVDRDANVYIAGGKWDVRPSGDLDYSTTKYDSFGAEKWTVLYDGPLVSQDAATALALDGSGNVYVNGDSPDDSTQYNGITIKYTASGAQQWIVRHIGVDQGRAFTVDASGNAYVAGTSYDGYLTGYDYVTIKYDCEGLLQWFARWKRGTDDWPSAITVDDSGNVYVTGNLTIKYSALGAMQWVFDNTGPGGGFYGSTLAVDKYGNVYVGGEGPGLGTVPDDFVTAKYNAAGVQQWVMYYDGPYNGVDGVYDLAIDSLSNVYVTGTTFSRGDRCDVVTIKYDAAGNKQWVAAYNHLAGEQFTLFPCIACDNLGNVYVTCSSIGTFWPDFDYATIKYNTAGVQQWVARYNGASNTDPYEPRDHPCAIALDAAGNVYVTGSSFGGPETGTDYATIKYDRMGNKQWVARYHDGDDGVAGLAVDPLGNAYVTGTSSIGTSSIITTIKYSTAPVSVRESAGRPIAFALSQNFPNPFNPSTTIKYELPKSSMVRLSVYDILGREVSVLVNERKNAGSYEVRFDGSGLSSGVYFYRLTAGNFVQTRKLLLMK